MTSHRAGERFFLKADFSELWTEVTRDGWISAERRAGFRPKLSSRDPDYMKVMATAGFSNGSVRGTYTMDGSQPEPCTALTNPDSSK